MAQKFANAARGLLASGINDSTTTIEIASGGSLFPVANTTDWFNAVLQDETGIEIVRVDTHTSASNTFTVVRGQEGTTARSFALGSVFGQRVTAGDMEGRVVATNGTASGLTLNDGYTEEVVAVTGTTPALSPTNGSIQTWTLTGNSTPTAGTWADGQSITLMIDDGTSYTITWTSLAVTWKTGGGTAPTLNTSGLTAIALWKVGSTIYGARVGDA
jgi:hypothetical protein